MTEQENKVIELLDCIMENSIKDEDMKSCIDSEDNLSVYEKLEKLETRFNLEMNSVDKELFLVNERANNTLYDRQECTRTIGKLRIKCVFLENELNDLHHTCQDIERNNKIMIYSLIINNICIGGLAYISFFAFKMLKTRQK